MKRIFFVVAAVIVSSFFIISCGDQGAGNAGNKPANANANAATSSAASEGDVRKFISDLGAALSKNDAAALDKLYADDYTFVSPEGEIQTKAQRLDSVKSGAMKFESLTFSDVKVRIYGDTAVVNAKTTAKGTLNGKDNSGTSTATIVLVKGKDGWRVVLGHPSTTTAAKTAEANTASNANKAAAPANK